MIKIDFDTIVKPFLTIGHNREDLPLMGLVTEFNKLELSVPRQTGKTEYLLKLFDEKFQSSNVFFITHNHCASDALIKKSKFKEEVIKNNILSISKLENMFRGISNKYNQEYIFICDEVRVNEVIRILTPNSGIMKHAKFIGLGTF